MRIKRATMAAAGLMALLAALAGCHEPLSVTAYEPGEYKGVADPLLKRHATPEQKDVLKQRFELSQTDR